MTFDEYQHESQKTFLADKFANKLHYLTLGLVGEAGEIANSIKKIERDDANVVTEERRATLKKELGDVLWYVANLSRELDISLEDIATGNLAKLFSRMERGVLTGAGNDR